MARRSDHSRDELYDMALEAARQIAEKEGLRGLKARGIAREIGYTIGTLYNLFEDLDDLIVHLNGRTLDALPIVRQGQSPVQDCLTMPHPELGHQVKVESTRPPAEFQPVRFFEGQDGVINEYQIHPDNHNSCRHHYSCQGRVRRDQFRHR